MSKKVKISLIITASVLAVTVLTILSGCLLFMTTPGYQVSRAVKNGDYQKAEDIYYDKVAGNSIQYTILQKSLEEFNEETVKKFNENKIDYSSAFDALQTMKKLGFDDSSEHLKIISEIKISADAFENAQKYFSDGQYEAAINEYLKISENDKNYQEAQEKLEELYPKFEDSAVSTIEEYLSSSNYKEAVEYVNKIKHIIPKGSSSTKLEEVKNESLSAYTKSVINDANLLINDKRFEDAIILIDEALLICDSKDLQTKKTVVQKEYIEHITTEVEKYLENEDYISAARVASHALTVIPDDPTLSALDNKVKITTPTYLLDACKPYAIDGYTEYSNGSLMYSGGNSYTNGFVLTYYGYSVFNIDNNYSTLNFSLGHEDGARTAKGTARIYCDGILKEEINLNPDDLPHKYEIDITGVQQLKFEFTASAWDHPRCCFGNITVK